jgi:hypothetical protein
MDQNPNRAPVVHKPFLPFKIRSGKARLDFNGEIELRQCCSPVTETYALISLFDIASRHLVHEFV